MRFDEIKNITTDFEMEELDNSFIVVCSDVRLWIENDMCTQILVQNGFKGKYKEAIGIGSTLSDISSLGLEWYEELDAYFMKGVNGICFELADTENDEEEWNELTAPIAYITVFKD